MKFGLDNTLTFGTHKGKTVRQVLGEAPHWLCWLRETKRKEGAPTPFTVEVHDAIDAEIPKHRSLRTKYKAWNVPKTDIKNLLADRQEQDAAALAEELVVQQQHEKVYQKQWASW